MELRRKDVQPIAGSTMNSGGTNKPVRIRDHYLEPSRQALQKGPSLSLPKKLGRTRRECNPGAWPLVGKSRRPSAVASDSRGRSSTTEAKLTISSSRRQGAAKQATTHRDDLALSRSFHNKGKLIGHV
jgi:hypothetical protein